MSTTGNRLTYSLSLQPVVGDIFQPTGFPDIGAATFEKWDRDESRWVDSLLVESVQSMANRLEATLIGPDNEPEGPGDSLPWVRVVDSEGIPLTNSRVEPHRLASAYVRDAKIDGEHVVDVIEARMGIAKGRPLDHHRMVSSVFSLDPLNILHGVFFAISSWPFQPKVTRAVTAQIEATDIRRVDSGGVKGEVVYHTVAGTGLNADRGYGMIPHHRVEYTAREIVLNWTLDRYLIRSYGLSEEAAELLEQLALFELAALLDGGLRLRTACDLKLSDSRPPSLDSAAAHASRVRELAVMCPELRDSITPMEVIWDLEGAGKGKS